MEDLDLIIQQTFLFNYHENKFLQEYKNDNTEEDPAQSLKKKRRAIIKQSMD